METIKVTSIEHLKELVHEGHNDFVCSYEGEVAYSKIILEGWQSDFFVEDLDHDEGDHLNADELHKYSAIGDAIDEGNFFCVL